MLTKFKNKYTAMPAPMKAALWFTICNILQRGIQFLVVPIYTRVLTTGEYGSYSVFQSWMEIVQVFCTFNLFYNSYNVGLTKYDRDRDQFTASMLGLCTVITMAVSVIYCLFRGWWNSLLNMSTTLCLLMLVHQFVKSPYLFWMARERYEYRYKAVTVTTLLLSVGAPVLSLAFIPFFHDKTVAVISGKTFVEIALGIPAAWLILRKGRTLFHRLYWPYGLKNNTPLMPYYLSQIILNHSDRIMIERYAGSSEAGIYSVAYSAAMLLTVINTAINNSVIPWKFQKLKNSDTEGIHSVTFALMALVMAMNAVLIALAPEAMAIMAPRTYHEAIWIVPPVACSAYLLFVSQQFINIEFYYEENQFASVSSIVAAVLNVFLNAVCIRRFGYIAAGYTTLVCYLLFTAFHYFTMRRVLRRHLDGRVIWNIRAIILMTAAFLVFAGVMILCYRGIVVRYLVVAFIAAILSCKRGNIMQLLKKKR